MKASVRKSPFKDCTSGEEVAQVIRDKLEELVGKRYRYFILHECNLSRTALLLTIEADRKKVSGGSVGRHIGSAWDDVLLGEVSPPLLPPAMINWDGGAFRGRVVGRSTARNESHAGTLSRRAIIELSNVPRIEALARANFERDEKLYALRRKQYVLTPAEKQVVKAYDDLQASLAARREAERIEYIQKHPWISIRTGKPE